MVCYIMHYVLYVCVWCSVHVHVVCMYIWCNTCTVGGVYGVLYEATYVCNVSSP